LNPSLVDLDFHIPRAQAQKTALPKEIRAKMGFRERSFVGRQSSGSSEKENRRQKYQIEKRPFLRKGGTKKAASSETFLDAKINRFAI
jgi:hypothetical protein